MKYHDIDDRPFCEVFACAERAERHHIISRGSGGSDEPYNILHLCLYHHRLGRDAYHYIGRATFAQRFPDLADKIKAACDMAGRKLNKEA